MLRFNRLDDFSIANTMTKDSVNQIIDDSNVNMNQHDFIRTLCNSIDFCYPATEYLFKADTERGKRLIRAINQAIPKDREFVYIIYTNTNKGSFMGRMVQNIFAFHDENEVIKWRKKMIEYTNTVPNSYYFEFPRNVQYNLLDNSWIGKFTDSHFHD